MIEVGDTFMDLAQEYKIVFKNEEKNRISIIPIGDFIRIPYLQEKIIIDNEYYKVTYIHQSTKRITLDLMRKGA